VVGQSLSVWEGGPAYWQPNPFGLDQEGFISFSQVDSTGGEQGVLLKSQGEDSDEPHGLIVVKYLAAQQAIRVSTRRVKNSAWQDYRNIPVQLVDGDRLRARVVAKGTVTIYRNDQKVASIGLRPRDRAFFAHRTGKIGLWFDHAPNAIIGDFGGGTLVRLAQ
jgi:hypothetical protein